MKKNHELREQLMQMKQTLKAQEAFNKANLEHNLFDEVRRLRVDIMMHWANYFIKLIEEKERP